MARAGIYKSEVVRARDRLLASGRYPSIDAVREELGNTGSKGTIHRYLKEIEEEEGPATGSRVAVSEAIQDLVGRLASRVNEEAQERVTAAQAQHAEQISQHEQAAAALKAEALSARQQLEQTQRTLVSEKAGHSKANEALSRKTLECTQLTQQVLDLQERLAAEERHRQSLEEKHQHARQALEHFRQSSKEQREQDQRKHEQQMQYLQAELRSVNEVLAGKRQEAVHALQENARLLGDLSRAQSDLHTAQEEVRSLRPLKDALGFAEGRTEALGQRLVEQDAALEQLSTAKDRLQAWGDGLLAEKQQLELALAVARASVAAQENIVASVLDRFVAAATASEAAVKKTEVEAEGEEGEGEEKMPPKTQA
ncbi:MAG: DNA-binding protein [Hydrogenophaga sp.]|uniref:DNA-binding protein n=1 Tax=Hydrogenophaga sp. TaxID=1904254 RepID=UPI002717533F|nr:DNA-binding protein [Hydrogenophaga sp.]MDO9483973.1 DNA-binding protein [Hydrogenophaga sp.]MDP3346311.1 DNA-binding protein [Hydrogenophaga sp.]MDP3806433.1 DNA-binding protein [Hydrogenophaga sp.]